MEISTLTARMLVINAVFLYLTSMIVRGQMTTHLQSCELSGADAKYCQVQELQEQVEELKNLLLGGIPQTQHEAGKWQEVFRFDTRWTGNVRDAWSVVFDTNLNQQWSRVKKVRYGMETDQITHYVTFDAAGTSKESWFTKERILDSSYDDLNSASPTAHVSVAGWRDVKSGRARRFYVQQSHGGCPADRGWFVVIDSDGTDRTCSWDNATPTDARPLLLFSPGKFSSLNAQYISADSMTISVIF